LTLRDMADATKVPLKVLDAIENNDSARLPHEFFTRGFVRAYAAEVGLDAGQTVEDYAAQFMKETPSGPVESAVSTTPESGTARSELRAGHVSALVLCSVVAGYAINSALTPSGAQAPAAPAPPPLVAAASVCITPPAVDSVPVVPVLVRRTRSVPLTAGTAGTLETSATAASDSQNIPREPSVVPLTIDSLPVVPVPTLNLPPTPSTPPIE
jgi:cytoskeletal protein RodZ